MPTFLQPVALPDRCFLQEVLYWVAFERLPIASYTVDGKELRETGEVGGYAVDFIDTDLSEDETARAGIPPDPDWMAWIEDRITLPVARYNDFLAGSDLDDDVRKKFEVERECAIAHEKACESWSPHYERAIEFPASRIFVALRGGSLRARGRLLPGGDLEMARSNREAYGRDVFDLDLTDIPPTFWSLQGIDFDASAARNGTDYYCHISCRTDDMISLFPGEREEATGVMRVGDSFVLSERPGVSRSSLRRGRPSYPWDAFHLEVAELLRRDELPEKKEATIAYFQSWFDREHGVKASRSVVGEKLKPYYDRFLRSGGQKKIR
jgi:hypothetical protein